jgi:predicted ATPase
MHLGRVAFVSPPHPLAMTTPPLIRRLTLQNFLSYGPEGVSVDLLPLNVLIGPNGSGKSNLLEALAILRATARDLQGAIREGGGIDEYIWKGEDARGTALLRVLVDDPEPFLADQIEYRIELARRGTRLDVSGEQVAGVSTKSSSGIEFVPAFHFSNGQGTLLSQVEDEAPRTLTQEDLKAGQSILSQRRDPERYREITFLADHFASIALFREWNFGARTPARLPQPTDLPTDFLLPDASNLGLILHDLMQTSAQREELIRYLRRFYEDARFISTRIQGGPLQLYIEEEGGRMIPASRLSDGTLRFLCLLAILCHPSPPPVLGIEEPELGLHPDILPTVAELIRTASERTQLFVTTHSDALISALSEVPEAILVCERMPRGTTMERLEPAKLTSWLEDYRLGEVWRMGELGGNRW